MRFPVEDGSELGASCPVCGAPTAFVDAPYETTPAAADPSVSGPPLEALIDNVRSLRNVGAIVRTADGVGLAHLHVCGFTPTPDHPRMDKTSLGAEKSVAWTQHRDGLDAVADIESRGGRLWALETGPSSVNLFSVLDEAVGSGPLAIVVGHEVSGVDPRIVARCERVVHLPMHGRKGSLNVAVAFGVALYALRHAGGAS